MDKKWDFKGWATRHNVKCSDGRTIKEGAFEHNNNQTVPLVWNHNHKDIEDVLGHTLLEYRKEGVYAYGKFNNTAQGVQAKEMVRNGDLVALSIYANKLKQDKNDVVHGNIREVSLVLAGANPGAYIEAVLFHGDGATDVEEAKIWNNADLEVLHSEEADNKDPETKTDPEVEVKDLKQSEEDEGKMTKEEQAALDQAEQDRLRLEKEQKDLEHSEKTIQEVIDTMNEEQQKAMYALIAVALEENGGSNDMKQNAFEKDLEQEGTGGKYLTHAEFEEAVKDAKRNGSLKEAFLAHGINDIDTLFPEVQSLNGAPELIARDMEWVAKVMAGVSKSPFSRVKSTAANITTDEARAKGYVKGSQKVEEVVTALKRTTTPTTVYKLQKLDRDDVIDITDFDVIVFLKAEMRVMLNEELARAFLIGDGRSGDSDDKINPLNIRPIYGDNAVYTVVRTLTSSVGATAAQKAKALIQDIIRSRKLYKGSGNPTFFTTEDELVEMLLLEDTNGRVVYESVDKLKTALRVKEIVTVPVMEGVNRVVGEDQFNLLGLLVNLTDYNVGADKGGQVSLFEDFDLNFNKHEYLIETRCSGALKKPYSAIVFESKGAVVAG